MSKLNFFTPVSYSAPSQHKAFSFRENIDGYFYLKGKKAFVIQDKSGSKIEKVILDDSKSSKLMCAAKIISYFTVIIPACMLVIKAALRVTHRFEIIDVTQALENEMVIHASTVEKIKSLMPQILKGSNNSEIEWLSKGNNLVFKLPKLSNDIFKIPKPIENESNIIMPNNNATDLRFENTIKGKTICLLNQLDLLVIPDSKKFSVNYNNLNYSFICEKNLAFNSDEVVQANLYKNNAKKLTETARQLAIFVAKSGFNDVIGRNMPILNADPSSDYLQVGLFDLEHMENALNGFIGDDNQSRGLIRSLPLELSDLVIKEASKQGVKFPDKYATIAKEIGAAEAEKGEQITVIDYSKQPIYDNKTRTWTYTRKNPVPHFASTDASIRYCIGLPELVS